MRVRGLIASEWGNSTYYPSSGGGREGWEEGEEEAGVCGRRTHPSLRESVSGAFFNILINNISPTRN